MSLVEWNGISLGNLDNINGLEFTQDNLAIGTLLFYDGALLGGDIGTRDDMIGAHIDDDISLNGWYVANSESGTYDMIDHFIRAEAASNDASLGSDDAIDVSHTHTTDTRGSHNHSLVAKVHKHTLPSSGSVWLTGGTRNHAAGGNARSGYNWYCNSDGTHDHTSFGSADGNHSHTVSGGASGGVAGTDKNIPAYYSVIVIQKVS